MRILRAGRIRVRVYFNALNFTQNSARKSHLCDKGFSNEMVIYVVT